MGDVEVKDKLTREINEFLEPLRQRRAEYASDPKRVEEILIDGTRRMRLEAQETMRRVHKAMGLYRPPI